MSRVSWNYLGVGALVGAALGVGAGYVITAYNNQPTPPAKTSGANAATGAGVGAIVGGLAKALTKKHSGTTLVAGALGGAALLAVAFLVSANPQTTPAVPSA